MIYIFPDKNIELNYSMYYENAITFRQIIG